MGKFLFFILVSLVSVNAQEWGDCQGIKARLRGQFYVEQRVPEATYRAEGASRLLMRHRPGEYVSWIRNHFEPTFEREGENYRIEPSLRDARGTWTRLPDQTLGMHFVAPVRVIHERTGIARSASLTWVLTWTLAHEESFERGWHINRHAYYPFGMYSLEDEVFLQWMVTLEDLTLEQNPDEPSICR